MRPNAVSWKRRLLSAALMLAGLAVLAWYPANEAVDAYRNAQALKASSAWTQASDSSDDDGTTELLLAQAQAYNALLAGDEFDACDISAEEVWDYDQQLSADGHDTAIGSVVIPSISLTVSLYRTTSDAVLSAGAGHLESSSLPIGGASTHAVICGHSGASGARCFDDLEDMQVGDVFALVVLGQTLAYRVTSIEVVLPEETESLAIVEGKDLVTLVTCTPYGVNDHRLLVHAERCEVTEELLAYLDKSAEESAVASTVASGHLVPFAAASTTVALGCLAGTSRGRRRRRARKKARRRIRSRTRASSPRGATRIKTRGRRARKTREGRRRWQRGTPRRGRRRRENPGRTSQRPTDARHMP